MPDDGIPEALDVINHAAKPLIDRHVDAIGLSGIRQLPRHPIACKISGLMTESVSLANPSWAEQHIRTLLDTFSPDRFIWGSDRLVMTTVSTDAAWRRVSQRCPMHLDPLTQDAITGGNAARIYRLESP